MSNPIQQQEQLTMSPLELGTKACQSIMKMYSPEQLPPAGRWHYHQGVFLVGMSQLWKFSGESKFLDYVKGYVDHLVDSNGNLLLERGAGFRSSGPAPDGAGCCMSRTSVQGCRG